MRELRGFVGEKEYYYKREIGIVRQLIFLCFVILISVYTSNKNYIFFHSIAEMFSVLIAFGMFIVSINSLNTYQNQYFIFLGIAFGFVGVFDLLHLLTFDGLGVFKTEGLNLTNQLWIAGRYIQSISLLLAFLLFYKTIKPVYTFVVYAFVSTTLIVLVINKGFFPECFIDGIGLTTFKKVSEYVISFILLLSLIIIQKNKNKIERILLYELSLSIVINIFSEICFTLFSSPYDKFNIIGHILKVIYQYYFYKATIETMLRNPYKQMISKLSFTEAELNILNSKFNVERTERRKIEESLLQNEECYNILIENSNDAILIHREGKIVFANNSAAKLFGFEVKDELITKQVMNYIHEDYKQKVKNVIENIYNGIIKSNKHSIKIKAEDEVVREVIVSSAHILYQGKNSILSLLHDITAEKNAEILQKNYDENKKLLDESLEHNKAIGEFTANIAHELRTPLNVILGALQVLGIYIKNIDNKEIYEFITKYLHIIRLNSYRLLRLVNNIVDVSKIDAGFFELQLENKNIVSVVEDITMSVVPYIENKGVSLIFDTDIEEEIIACDPEKIERIILNLLSNAAKFTEAGDEIKVIVKENKNSIIIKVKDTGIGIPKDKLPLIFKRYTQIDKSLSRNRYGCGIGLSLVKSLVQLHKGVITVQSEVGKGTEFIIELPITRLKEDKVVDLVTSDQNLEKVTIEFSEFFMVS
ncbi:ATP-binding protein [Clostridium sp. SYSU_GA19001]|uniref:sensor histidine kinase n=1 Tax=Clostridium caldaquaticum TaxID=2940653 RepID=UPI0020776055|nr:MASE3 domain-containing protein [Clostridium caldaquaticum]MCM8709669.1 ATP-binding protein [Clostridium caldaquaticum]